MPSTHLHVSACHDVKERVVVQSAALQQPSTRLQQVRAGGGPAQPLGKAQQQRPWQQQLRAVGGRVQCAELADCRGISAAASAGQQGLLLPSKPALPCPSCPHLGVVGTVEGPEGWPRGQRQRRCTALEGMQATKKSMHSSALLQQEASQRCGQGPADPSEKGPAFLLAMTAPTLLHLFGLSP